MNSTSHHLVQMVVTSDRCSNNREGSTDMWLSFFVRWTNARPPLAPFKDLKKKRMNALAPLLRAAAP